MKNKALLIEIFSLALLILVLHSVATKFSLYWTIPWLDIPMHFLGGLLIGLMTVFLFFTSGYIKYPKNHKIVVLSVLFGSVLIVGLTWELWELFMGLSDVLRDVADTVLDVIMDLIGGTVAYLYTKNKIWQEN